MTPFVISRSSAPPDAGPRTRRIRHDLAEGGRRHWPELLEARRRPLAGGEVVTVEVGDQGLHTGRGRGTRGGEPGREPFDRHARLREESPLRRKPRLAVGIGEALPRVGERSPWPRPVAAARPTRGRRCRVPPVNSRPSGPKAKAVTRSRWPRNSARTSPRRRLPEPDDAVGRRGGQGTPVGANAAFVSRAAGRPRGSRPPGPSPRPRRDMVHPAAPVAGSLPSRRGADRPGRRPDRPSTSCAGSIATPRRLGRSPAFLLRPAPGSTVVRARSARPGLPGRHVPEARWNARDASNSVLGSWPSPASCRRSRGGRARQTVATGRSSGSFASSLRRDDRERTPLLPGFNVPEPDGRGPSAAERQERLAIRQERHHGSVARGTAWNRSDEPGPPRHRRAEPGCDRTPLLPRGPDAQSRSGRSTPGTGRPGSPRLPARSHRRCGEGILAGRVPDVEVAVLVGGEQPPAVGTDQDLRPRHCPEPRPG